MTPGGNGEIDVGETLVRDVSVDPATARRAKRVRWEIEGKLKRLEARPGQAGATTTITIRGLSPGTEVLQVRVFVDDDPKGQLLAPVEFTIYPLNSSHGVRSLGTWGDSKFDTDVYQRNRDCGGQQGEGVHIRLRFKPGPGVDAETIALIQTVKAQQRGTPHLPDPREGPETARVIRARSIAAGQPGEGTHIDPSGYGDQPSAAESTNPLYATDPSEFVGRTTLEGAGSVETRDQYGQHGWRYRDDAGKLHAADALLEDRPCLANPGPNAGQVFETTALAVEGAQRGTYYGSVQWGWQTDARGEFALLPLTLVSEDAPSETFSGASLLWNVTPTSKNDTTIALPLVLAMYTIENSKLRQRPDSNAKIVGPLPVNTRLEVTDPADRLTAGGFRPWRRATVLDGPLAGKVGWVLAKALVKADS